MLIMDGLFEDTPIEKVSADFEMTFNTRPVPKASVRFDGKRSFLPSKTRTALHDIKMLSSQYKDQLYLADRLESPTEPIFTKAVAIWVIYAFIRPKSVSESKRPWPSVKPDIDNLTKLLLDGLQPHVLKDDSLVCELYQKKIYSHEECTVIKIKEV